MGPKDTRELIERCVGNFLQTHNLAHHPQPLVVGVSGGPDSLCLLHALDHLKEKLGLVLHVAHLNHCLRGRESEADAMYVSQVAEQTANPSTIGREDVMLRYPSHSRSLEEMAREARYDFLAQVAEDTGAMGAVVAHTGDDQVETVLLHLLRGSAVAGLRGMRPVNALNTPSGRCLTLFRPLLDVTRMDTVAYCNALGLIPRSDPSNQSNIHLRNRIRLKLIPVLRDYNPNIEGSLRRLAASASLDMDFIEAEVDRVWASVVKETPDGLQLDKEKMSKISPSLRRHLLRRGLETLLGDLVDIEQSHVIALEKMMSKPAGKSLCLPRGVVATMEYGQCLLTRGQAEQGAPPLLKGEYKLTVPGVTQVGGWMALAKMVNRDEYCQKASGLKVALDLEMVGQDLTVRTRQPGDRFQPMGMNHSKKLQDFLVDCKVPRRWRDRIPLVWAQGRIVWVVGWRIDEQVKMTESTARVLLLEFEQTDSPAREVSVKGLASDEDLG